MGHLTHDEFFTKLADIFTSPKTKGHGSVFLTQKRLTPPQQQQTSSPPPSSDPPTNPFTDLHPSQPLPLIIRATNGKGKEARATGKKIKLSTVVQADELEGFYARYAEVCKAGMTALKPRDRTKRKAKDKAKKRKGGVVAPAS